MKKSSKGIIFAVGALGVGVYNYVLGNGIFNGYRFKNEHLAASKYIDTHYKNAVYSPIKQAGDGFLTVITTEDNKKIILTFTKTDDGMYIFSQKDM